MTTTPSQTIGPFWHMLENPDWADLTRFGAEGDRIVLMGRLTDGDGAPVTDGCVELWQLDPAACDTFPAWGRCATDTDGRFRFVTLRPGPVPGLGNTLQAPHFAITILARGILKALVTRAYFEGDPRNDADPVLSLIEDPARRQTLLARPENDGWHIDIRLQGEGETVFLEV
jgi:protocatechuate 3,4-dioxygenase alpha subunit